MCSLTHEEIARGECYVLCFSAVSLYTLGRKVSTAAGSWDSVVPRCVYTHIWGRKK